MKISIITICKNAAQVIEKTFKSVIEQSYNNYELIVIDGLSTDNTIEIINKYKDNIKYFISESDTGIYNAMNKGIEASSGEIIYFLNAGDTLFDKNTLNTINVEFQRSNADIIFGNMFCLNTQNYSENDLNMKPNSLYTYDFYNSGFSFITQSICQQVMFYKKSLFDKFGKYNENYKIYGDWEINARFMLKNKCNCKYINKTITNFDLGGISTHKTLKTDKIRQVEFNNIKNNYFKLDYLFYNIIYINLYNFMSKNLRSLLRKYDENTDIKITVDNFFIKWFAKKVNIME